MGAIALKQVTKRFGEVEEGEFIVFVGPSGGGNPPVCA